MYYAFIFTLLKPYVAQSLPKEHWASSLGDTCIHGDSSQFLLMDVKSGRFCLLKLFLIYDTFIILLISLVFGKNKDKSKIYIGVASLIAGILTGGFIGIMFAAISVDGSMEIADILPFFISTIVVAALYFICGISNDDFVICDSRTCNLIQ